uniref:Zinc finger MYND-type containing 8 n=1 Tax=Leptobrachium leishanense TaxID=445787 RepID=A0A8C5MUE8_9ANUR
MHPQSLAVEDIKTEPEVVEGMDVTTRSKGPALAYPEGLPPEHGDSQQSTPSTAERPGQKRRFPSPQHSSNGHSPQDSSTSPSKKKKKPGQINSNNKDQKITVAECIETQSKAMTMLTIEQLSYLLKFALQKMKQPGTEPFQKPVSLEQHPDYSEYIFNPMDLSTLEKNVKKKMYGCTEAFLADAKWILHNCIIYNGGNHKLTQMAKIIIKICEHEMNEIEVCPECYLAACQKRENWFCEPCSNPHPLVWAKLKGFPFWPAKALRDKDGQVDARFFGQHDRAWVPMNNCYLMSKEIPFSVKKTKSIFNSAMQEMEVYVENIRKRFGVFNYAPFRTPYTPNNQYQMLLDTANPSAGTAKTDKQEKIKLNFDMTASPKILMSKPLLNSGGRRISLTDMPRSPMSTNSSVHTGSDAEQDTEKKVASSHYSASEESMDFIDKSTASPVSTKTGPGGSLSDSPKPFSPQSTPLTSKQDRTSTTGSILNLNLDRSKAEMDLKELSESVLQQSATTQLISPKRQIRSRFQLNLDKTIESCKAQLGINEISEDVYTAVEHSDSEESDKTDSSDIKKKLKTSLPTDLKEEPKSTASGTEKSSAPNKDKISAATTKDVPEKSKTSNSSKEKLKGKDEMDSSTVRLGLDSDSENELVIDLGDEHSGREGRKSRKEPKETVAKNHESKASAALSTSNQPQPETPILTRSAAQAAPAVGVTVTTSAIATLATPAAATGSPVKKQRPLLPKETVPTVQRVVWNSSSKFQTSSQKWHMQKVQRQQQQQQQPTSTPSQSPQGTRYQTRQAVKAVQQKEITQTTTTSTITLVTSAPPLAVVTSPSNALSTPISTDLPIATASADVAADIAKYTSKMMDAIKGTMTEIYNDLSKNSTGSTIAEIRRLRIEIEKLQWLHQQELSEMKHNLELTMAEMRQSLEQERDRLIAEVKKQTELEKQQAVDETKKKQWCANCKKEAIFYCCWNTSYCDYPCQQAHWPEHMKSCTQSATATQQEADPELSADKSAQPTSGVQQQPAETSATPKEKESTVEKSKESVTIATGVTSNQPIKLVQVPQATTYIPSTQPTITIPVVVSPSAGTVAVRTGVQYVQTTMPVQVRRV